MARTLLILRHAKSSWDSDAATDFDRPLAKRGEKDAPRMGAWMKQEGLRPDHVVSSPAQRAKQTVLAATKKLGIEPDAIHWEPEVYGASLRTLLQVLAACPSKAKTVLLVGHNPGLEELVEHLGGTGITLPADGKLLPTAALARIELPRDWESLGSGSGRLLSITRPKELV